MARTYIEWCRLLNRLSAHSWDANTPAQYEYWQRHRTRLVRLLNSKGWGF